MNIITLKKITSTMLTAIILIIISGNNIVHCGNLDQDNATTNLQEMVRGMFDTMNQAEVDEFGREIGFQLQLEPRRGWPAETNVDDPMQTRREALYIFIAGSIALFLISHYGNDILDIIVSMGRDMAQEAIPQFVQQFFPRQQVRDYAFAILQTPEGQERVLRGMIRINNLRRGAGA